MKAGLSKRKGLYDGTAMGTLRMKRMWLEPLRSLPASAIIFFFLYYLQNVLGIYNSSYNELNKSEIGLLMFGTFFVN